MTGRERYLSDCAAITEVWDTTIGAEDGALPGARLDSLVTPQGWCGHVQLAGQHISDIMAAEGAIAAAFGLAAGCVVVRTLGEDVSDATFLWAYTTPSGADHTSTGRHPRWTAPSTSISNRGPPVPACSTWCG